MIDLRSGANAVNALYKLPYIIIRFPGTKRRLERSITKSDGIGLSSAIINAFPLKKQLRKFHGKD